MLKYLKLIFSCLLLANLSLAYAAPALADSTTTPITQGYDYSKAGVSDTIKQFLCTPTEPGQTSTNNTGGTAATTGNTAANDLNECINKLYRFAIAFGSVIAVFFIVIGGYIYMNAGGNQESVDKAKSILESSITGLVILFGIYILLKGLNPQLLRIPSIQPPTVQYAGSQLSYSNFTTNYTPLSGATPTGAGQCSVMSSTGCAADKLSACSYWDSKMASAICNLESGGGNASAESGSDKCSDGNSWSLGLFQINIIVHGGQSYMPAACPKNIIQTNGSGTAQGNCLSTSNGVCVKYDCKVINTAAYQACKQALSDPTVNANIACQLYKQASGWGPWAYSYNKCSK